MNNSKPFSLLNIGLRITVVSACVISFMFLHLGCKKLVDVDAPTTSLVSENVFTNDATAAAVLTGIYTNMSMGQFASGNRSVSLLSGLSADELTVYSIS